MFIGISFQVDVVKVNTRFSSNGWPEELQQFRYVDICGYKHTRDKPQVTKNHCAANIM